MLESALFWIAAVKSTIYLSFCHIWPAVTALWTIHYCQAELGTFVKLKQEQLNKENWLKLIRFKWFLVLWASYLEHKVPFFPNMIKSRQNQISHSFENFFLFCEIFIQFIKRFFVCWGILWPTLESLNGSMKTTSLLSTHYTGYFGR